jgi:drug/metabolite transporter (DMT)-like permease
MFALAVYLARGRRHQTLIEVGVAFIAAGLVVVVARGIIGTKVVDSLATTEAVRPAAQAAWSIATSVLADIAWSTVLIGIPLILAGLLAGPTRGATNLRRLMAPYLRDRPDITFGAVALLLLLLFAWGPIVATKTLIGILIIVVLAVFGTEMLRRETAEEFPDVHSKTALAGASPPAPGPPQQPSPTPGEHTPHQDPGSEET